MGTALPAWVDAGAGLATCNLLTAGSQYAAGAAVASAATLTVWPTITLAAASAAMGMAAASMNCLHNPGDPSSMPGVTGSWCPDRAVLTYFRSGTTTAGSAYGVSKVRPWKGLVGNTWYLYVDVTGYTNPSTGTPVVQTFQENSLHQGIRAEINGTCSTASAPGAGTADSYNYPYYDTSTQCTYTYQFKGATIGPDGLPQIQWQISGGNVSALNEVLATGCQGGIIGGYNWSLNPTFKYSFNPTFGGPGGGGGGGGPLAVGDWFAKLAQLLSYYDPGDLYRLRSVCELDADGEPIDRAVEVVIPAGIAPVGGQINKRIDALVQLLQGHKDFKQPICPPTKPTLTGDLVSVRFLSQADSPMSNQPLRKLLRYRDQSFSEQCVHANHWEGFTWEAGPVCVISKGLSWGVPQVWASTADEGKRVIAHAAAVAGVDLSDPAHSWVVSHSVNPRNGQPGQMEVAKPYANSIWVTKREGPSRPPDLCH